MIGYLPEHPPLYAGETPEEYLRFVGEAKGVKGEELQRQVDEVIRLTGIDKVKDRLISALSKGYCQRVGIAQALIGNPEIIILDEPTVGLDPIQIIDIRELIRELGKTHTVIFSSHILSEVQSICEQVLIISKGTLAAFDAPDKELILHISRDPEKLASAQKKAKEGEEIKVPGYVRAGDSRIVYRISEDTVSALMAASYDDLRHKEVLTAAFEDINQIDVSLDGNSYRLFTKGTGSRKVWHYKENDKLDTARLQEALTGLRAESFTTETPGGKEELSLTVHLDNKNHPEVSIRLYRYDGERCLAVINGESVSLVPRSSVVSLTESIYSIVLKKE